MAGEINKKRITMPNGQQYVLNPDEQTVVQPDTRYQNSVTPHSRPLETPVDESGVIRSNRVAQRNAEQQARMAAAANSPVANNVQQVVDAAQVAPAGAVGNDSPDIQKANLFAKKYAPMLRGEEVKPAGEQLLADRTAKYQNQLMPKTPAKTVDPNSDTDGMNSILGNWTSKEDEEKYRKASVARQRIMAVADALRHIGNIYHTTKYAPSQKFNMPVEAERQRYQQEKALRDQANQRIMTYQMAKQKMEADQDRWNATFKYNAERDAAKLKAQQEAQEAGLAEKQRQFDANMLFNKEREKNANEIKKAQIKQSDTNNRRSTGLGYANLAQRKKEFDYKVKNGGGNGRTNTITLRGKNGWYSKKMNSEEAAAFYNQTYDEMKKRGLINEQSVLNGLPADIFGQKSLSLAAKKAAVDNALLYEDATGDWLANEYEFEFDPRYGESEVPYAPKPQPQTLFSAPWSNNRGNPFEERQQSIQHKRSGELE